MLLGAVGCTKIPLPFLVSSERVARTVVMAGSGVRGAESCCGDGGEVGGMMGDLPAGCALMIVG